VNIRVEVGVVLEYNASTLRDRDARYAQIRTAFEKLEPWVEKQYGVRMSAEVAKLVVTGEPE
jgi:hypothetical protein